MTTILMLIAVVGVVICFSKKLSSEKNRAKSEARLHATKTKNNDQIVYKHLENAGKIITILVKDTNLPSGDERQYHVCSSLSKGDKIQLGYATRHRPDNDEVLVNVFSQAFGWLGAFNRNLLGDISKIPIHTFFGYVAHVEKQDEESTLVRFRVFQNSPAGTEGSTGRERSRTWVEEIDKDKKIIKITWSLSGLKYLGEGVNTMPAGKGKFFYKNGDTIEGRFYGFGKSSGSKYSWVNGDYFVGTVKPDFTPLLAEGNFTFSQKTIIDSAEQEWKKYDGCLESPESVRSAPTLSLSPPASIFCPSPSS